VQSWNGIVPKSRQIQGHLSILKHKQSLHGIQF
jgi:hypothetical protein